ncbi:thermonuclease family protein [Thermus thermophilus]|uniref:thermonuclease family protein n=1 Tax=Thermus thermophilus TaxID=274 RepID=UPI003BAA49FA
MERETVKVRWISLFLFLLSLALAQSLVGRASVVDGDTLEIQGVRVRLWGIDAVESSQTCLDVGGKPWPCGRRAAFALADFLGQRTVRCERRDTDRYGRVVAVCHVGGLEVNRWRACLAKVRRTGVYLSPDGQARLPSQGGKPQGGLGTLPAPGPGGGPSHPQRQAGPPLALQPRPLPGPPSLPRLLPPHLPRDGGLTPGPDGRPLPFPPVPGPLRPQAPGPQTP